MRTLKFNKCSQATTQHLFNKQQQQQHTTQMYSDKCDILCDARKCRDNNLLNLVNISTAHKQERAKQQQQQGFCRKFLLIYTLVAYLLLLELSCARLSAGLLTINVRQQQSTISLLNDKSTTQQQQTRPNRLENVTYYFVSARRDKRSHLAHVDNDDADESSLSNATTATTTTRRSAKLVELDALHYLERYGYMNSSGGGGNAINLISEDSFRDAIVTFQRFAGIPESGSVDSLTMRYMQLPRCGNKDMSGRGENGKRRKRRRRKRRKRRRKKRYALQGSKWRRQELTYRISQYPSRFAHKRHEVDGQIEKAFKIWSQVAPIDFVVKKEGRVHIDIRFASGEHGDGDPFDGPGNTLAHAYFPQYGGDAHFDDQEYWTVDSYAGTNIFQVAAHELGHSLGLGHSSVREALMAPFYQKYKPNFKLHADDVLGIQALYGERAGDNDTPADDDDTPARPAVTTEGSVVTAAPPRRAARPTTETPDTAINPFGGGGGSKPVDLCQDARLDAITRTEDGNTYAFRGQHYWLLKPDGIVAGYPARIARDWDGLPGNLDAALTWSDGKTFFFKGDKYWRFFNKRREPGYPKQISVGFAGIPNNLDAAFVWSGNGKTYFFKRDKYWRFDSKQEPPVSGQYPKALKNWAGLPASGVDAAFKWDNGMTYFFKNDLYYRFDDRQFEVDASARPHFPRSTAEWWFGCAESNNLAIVRKSNASDEIDNEQPVDDQLAPSGSSSSVLFHRSPALSYESRPSSSSSISRSIISSLSALFPSTFATRDSTTATDSTALDWSFHRGVGEEARRRLLVAHKNARLPKAAAGETTNNSRWSFPLASATREQSLSELRLLPSDNTTTRRR